MATRKPDIYEITADWDVFTGGPPVVGALGTYWPTTVDALVEEDGEAGTRALICWAIHGDGLAELVSVHAEPPGVGAGARLIEAVERRLAGAGVRKIVVATTNDNTGALAFYQRQGYRLVEVRLDFMDTVRAAKPAVPIEGNGGIPLRDLWVLEKALER